MALPNLLKRSAAWRRFKIVAEYGREFLEDGRRYLRFSIPSGRLSRLDDLHGMHLDAATTKAYHRIEKGLSLAQPRQPFGEAVKVTLGRATARTDLVAEQAYIEQAATAVEALDEWNTKGTLSDLIAPLGATEPVLDPATTAAFIESRHSVRNFDKERPVERAVVEEAVRLAGTAPSVCNRQSARAYYFDDPKEVARLLKEHRGSSGFKTSVRGLFILTYDISAFVNSGERNQGWIDGGLFSMTLIFALHGLGLGTVPLNWSRRNHASARLRGVAKIPDSENIVMMLGIGYPAPGYRVARSPRRPLSQILRIGLPTD